MSGYSLSFTMEETRVAKNCKGSNNTFIHKISEIIMNLYILISFSFFETFILIINSKFSLVIKLKKKKFSVSAW